MDEQLTLFDSPLNGKVKSEKSLMAYPFFDLTVNGRRKKALTFSDGLVHVEVQPGAHGCATVYDKDLLLYVMSLMVQRLNAGEEVKREFYFTAHDFMTVAGRDTSNKSYANIEKMINRLQSTMIKTNIEVDGIGVDQWFSWLENARVLYYRDKRGRKVMQGMRVTICEWLFEIVQQLRVLTFHDDYFKLRPLERRLYDLARSHCGNQGKWKIGLERLMQRVGFDGPLRRFRYELENTVERLPEYDMELLIRGENEMERALDPPDHPTTRRKVRLDTIQVIFTKRVVIELEN